MHKGDTLQMLCWHDAPVSSLCPEKSYCSLQMGHSCSSEMGQYELGVIDATSQIPDAVEAGPAVVLFMGKLESTALFDITQLTYIAASNKYESPAYRHRTRSLRYILFYNHKPLPVFSGDDHDEFKRASCASFFTRIKEGP